MSNKIIKTRDAWIIGLLGLLGVIITKIDKYPNILGIFSKKIILKSKISKPTNRVYFLVTDTNGKIINKININIFNQMGKDNIPTSSFEMTCDSTGLYMLRLVNYENIFQILKQGFESRTVTITPEMVKNNQINLGKIQLLEE